MAYTTADNDYATAKFIVGVSGKANYLTIATAITAASSGDTIYIQPGTYTENLSLKAGVNLVSFDGNNRGNVTIIGKLTLSTAGVCLISNILLQTNSDFIVAVTAAGAAAQVYLYNCNLNMSNNTGLSISGAAAGNLINCVNCEAGLGTTGIAFFATTFGTITLLNCNFGNSGNSTTASTGAGTNVLIVDSYFFGPITISSACAVQIFGSNMDCRVINAIPLTHGGAGANSYSRYSFFDGGTASALSVGSTLDVINCDFTSSNTNAIAGAGTVNLYNSGLTGTSKKSSVTTQTGGAASGLTQGTAPSAGFLGEQLTATVLTGASITVNNATQTNIASVSLTAGIWDVSSVLCYSNAGTGNLFVNTISTTSATGGTIPNNSMAAPGPSPTASSDSCFILPRVRLTLSATTTVYQVAFCGVTAGTMKAFGRITATRVG